MNYPYSWTSAAGHEVVVLNPCEGRYEFHIMTTEGKKETMVCNENGPEKGPGGGLGDIQKTVYDEWSEMR